MNLLLFRENPEGLTISFLLFNSFSEFQ